MFSTKLRQLVMLLLCGVCAAGAEFSMTDSETSLDVRNDGTLFRINKKPVPAWGRYAVLLVGEHPVAFAVNVQTGEKKAEMLFPAQNVALTVEEDSALRKVIRAEYRLAPIGKPAQKSADLKLLVYFHFIPNVPGAAVTGRLVSECELLTVNLFSATIGKDFTAYTTEEGSRREFAPGKWDNIPGNYVIAEKGADKLFISPRVGGTPSREFCASVANRWKVVTLGRGEALDFPVMVGYGKDADSVAKLKALRQSVRIAPETERTKTPSGVPPGGLGIKFLPRRGAMPAADRWSADTLLCERAELEYYRPAEANNWGGPNDLGFKVHGFFDLEKLYLGFDVTDDDIVQNGTGTEMWMGDCIQIAFDPLNEKELGKNYVCIGLSPGAEPNFCVWSHPTPDALPPDIRHAVRKTAKGWFCEIELPWKFLAPFDPKLGKIGFNAVVLDKNGGNWMGITDGIAGGKNPALFQSLYLEGFEQALAAAGGESAPELLLADKVVNIEAPVEFPLSAFVAAEDLPAELLFELGALRKRFSLVARFNSFAIKADAAELSPGSVRATLTLSKKGADAVRQTYELELIDADALRKQAEAIDADAKTLRRKIARLSAPPSYLLSKIAVAEYFATRIHLLAAYRDAPDGKKRAIYKKYLSRSVENLRYLRKMLQSADTDADAMLAGKLQVITVPRPAPGVRPIIRNGGFAVADRELFLVGPNTWRFVEPELLPLLGETGINFFNYYFGWQNNAAYVRGAESSGLYANVRDTVRNGYDGYFEPKTGSPAEHPNFKNIAASPSLVFAVTSEENNILPKDLYARFNDRLATRFASPEAMRQKTGYAPDAFGAVSEKETQLNQALKYELFLFTSGLLEKALAAANAARRQYWGLPLSTHFSELMFRPYDALLRNGDMEAHWKSFDIVGFDAGFGSGVTRDFSLNIAGSSILLCDMARSFYPGRPIVNNEEYIVPVSNPTITVPEAYHYAGAFLPALHGRAATSIFLMNPDFGDHYTHFTWDRADAFVQTARAALDLNRFADEVAAFRNQTGPAAILYTMPSFGDRYYAERIEEAFAGSYFSGFPCRFVSDRMVREGKLRDIRILLIPGAEFVSDELFAEIASFAASGGKVLIHGKNALSKDAYGNARPERRKTVAGFTAVADGSPRGWFAAFEQTLNTLGEKPAVQVLGPDGKHVWAVEYRSVPAKDGKTLLYIVNVGKTPVTVTIPGERRWRNLLTGRECASGIPLQPLEIHLLKNF